MHTCKQWLFSYCLYFHFNTYVISWRRRHQSLFKTSKLHYFSEIIKKLELASISMTSRFVLLHLLSKQNECVSARVTEILFASWEVRRVKNRSWTEALKLRPRAAFSRSRSQFFTTRTDSKPANNLFILSCGKLAYKPVCLRNFLIELAYVPCTDKKALHCCISLPAKKFLVSFNY